MQMQTEIELNLKFKTFYQKTLQFLENECTIKYLINKDYNSNKLQMKSFSKHIDKFIQDTMPEYSCSNSVEIELHKNGHKNGNLTFLFLLWNKNILKKEGIDFKEKGIFRKLIVTLDANNKASIKWEDITLNNLTLAQKRKLVYDFMLYAVNNKLISN